MTKLGSDLIKSLKQATALARRHKRNSKRRKVATHRTLTANPTELRALAAKQTNRRIAKRLRVIALLAEGIGTLDAAARERVNETTVREWRAWYREDGVAALLRVPGGARPRLTKEQSIALAAIIRQEPEISYVELRAEVQRRFKVAYTESGIAAYITRQLGFMRHDGRFWGMTSG